MEFSQNLHDRDFNLWIEKTKRQILARDFENMDWNNLIEELEDMGKSEKRALESYLQRLIEHILKRIKGLNDKTTLRKKLPTTSITVWKGGKNLLKEQE